jgi:hypothetical protein
MPYNAVGPCEAAQKRISQSLQQLQRADPDLYELALMGEEASNAILSYLIHFMLNS